MNNRYSMGMAFLMLFSTVLFPSYALGFQSLRDRQSNIVESYNAILQKWELALDNPSEESLRAVIKSLKQSLASKITNGSNYQQDMPILAKLKDLGAWPYQFICDELDRDIQTLIALNQEIYVLDSSLNALDITPFQELRAQIETMDCLKSELNRADAILPMYKKYMALLGVGALAYIIYKTNAAPVAIAEAAISNVSPDYLN